MMSRSILLFGPIALCTASGVRAASDSQVWLTSAANVKLSDKWRLSEEVTTRFSDKKGGLYEVEMHTLLGYRLSKTVTAWAGYTHDPQYARGKAAAIEHRAREQITVDNFASLLRGKLSARVRFEQRWRSNADGTGWRVRPFIRYTLPFKPNGGAGITFSSESFFNLDTTSFQTKPGLDRMRNLVAFTTPIGKHLTGEFGYMNQHIFVDRQPDESDNIAWISVGASF